MLNINFEFRHGVFFIRLYGSLTSKTKNKLYSIEDIIRVNGIKYIAFNLENLVYIDKSGIKFLNNFYDEVAKYNGQAFICGINKKIVNSIKKSNITSIFRKEDNELSIMHNIDIIYNE